jgi:death-on-curing family protein
MHSKKRGVDKMAMSFGLNPDDALILLWEKQGPSKKFDYLQNPGSHIRIKHLSYARGILAAHVAGKQVAAVIKDAPKQTIHYDFSNIGNREDDLNYLSKKELVLIHDCLADDMVSTGDPISPVGIRDEGLLESALFRPQSGYEGFRKYPTVETSAAALMYAISGNHAFHNGNKRSALVALLVFLDRYNISLTCSEDELFKLSMSLAKHEVVDFDSGKADAEVHQLAKWIVRNSKKIVKGERPITYRRLMQILRKFNCKYESDTGWVIRTIKPYPWSFPKKLSYKITTSVTPGYEVNFNLIKGLRRQLHLDANSGVDQEAFYGDAGYTTSDFIHKYRNLLRRLSKQ